MLITRSSSPFAHFLNFTLPQYITRATPHTRVAMTVLKRNGAHLSTDAVQAKKPKQGGGTITSFFSAPKPNAGNGLVSSNTSASPRAKFDKKKWAAGLTPEQRDLLELEIDTLDESWMAHLKDELVTKEFLNLKRFLKKEIASGAKIFPPLEDVYSWYGYIWIYPICDKNLLLSYFFNVQVSAYPIAQGESRRRRTRPIP